jgi:hypothetical protein
MDQEPNPYDRFLKPLGPPEPDENMTYKEETTVTEDRYPPLPGPPQESGTMLPHS